MLPVDGAQGLDVTRPESKAEELAHVRAMIEEMPELGVVVDPADDRESPDFVLTIAGGRRVGLEHVRAMDERVATGRGTKKRIKRQLRDLLAKRGVLAHVYVSMAEGSAAVLATTLFKAQLNAEVEAIAKLAADTLVGRGEDAAIRFGTMEPQIKPVDLTFLQILVLTADVIMINDLGEDSREQAPRTRRETHEVSQEGLAHDIVPGQTSCTITFTNPGDYTSSLDVSCEF
jgi:hypothetical protein